MQHLTKQQKAENAAKAEQVAKGLYPHEKWELLQEGIYIAESRKPQNEEETNVLNKELKIARLLVTDRGSTIYLLPEWEHPKVWNKKYPDAVVDGIIMEFKIVEGNERKIKENYKEGRAKADNVFLYIEPPFTDTTVAWKLLGTIRAKGYEIGLIWVYFTYNKKTVYWTVDDFKKKNPSDHL